MEDRDLNEEEIKRTIIIVTFVASAVTFICGFIMGIVYKAGEIASNVG